jgi:hypothetical protein
VSFTRSASLLALSICAGLAIGRPAAAQDRPAQTQPAKVTPPDNAKKTDTIVLSGVAITARIADPNEPVVFNGYVMRMSDFVAAVSSNSEAVQHLRNPETRSREKDQPVPPSKPSR